MRTNKLVYSGLFAAIIGIMSQIALPVQPVPVNLGVMAVLLAGGFLGKKYGALSVLVYIALGIAGAPVFAGFRGGLAVMAGPTGGYIAGYVTVAFVTGLVCERTGKTSCIVMFMLLSLIICYLLGTVWYCCVMKTGFLTAFALCVLPFVLGDVIKIVLAVMCIKKFRIS